MKYQVTTKQGTTYEVNDEAAMLWLNLERDKGLTVTEASEKLQAGSLDILTFIIWQASVEAGHTELKTQDAWVRTEFETFDVVTGDPKATKRVRSTE